MTEIGPADTVEALLLQGTTYEAAESELVELIGKLEAGDVPLEASLQMWERATLLRAVCEQLLTDARSRLTSGAAGGTTTSVSAWPTAARAESNGGPSSTPDGRQHTATGWDQEPPF